MQIGRDDFTTYLVSVFQTVFLKTRETKHADCFISLGYAPILNGIYKCSLFLDVTKAIQLF